MFSVHVINIKHLLPVVMLFFLALIQGCATLDKNECLGADWQSIGYQDGLKGYAQTRLDKHRKACAEHGVKPELDNYLAGHDKGLLVFCQPANGFRRGMNGLVNNHVCTGSLRKLYNAAHAEGDHIYVLHQKIRHQQKVIDRQHKRILHLEDKREMAEQQLINNKLSRHEREQFVKKIRELDDKKQAALNVIRDHEIIRVELTEEAEYLKRHSQFR